jgi:hypothetical protein
MSRYRVVKDGHTYEGTMPKVEIIPHPEQPAEGFETWSEAELWLNTYFLAPHIWRVEPIRD